MGRKSSTLMKERLKSLRKLQLEKKPEEQLGLEDEIKQLESRIHICQKDLDLFPNNSAIINKIQIMEEQLSNLKLKLA
jgi:hypothetical protein